LPVALKLIRLSGRLGGRERSNLRILRAVRHPNLLAYFGAWTFDDLLVIGMELADRSLWDRFKEAADRGLSGIPLAELLAVLGDAARVLDFLHEPRHELDGKAGVAIFHRDIKPQNIMLLSGGVKVADFGLSSLEVKGAAVAAQGGLTYPYAAPETFRKEVVNQSDQYSLAVTYCLLRCGRLPFTGPPALMMLGHLFQAPELSTLPEPERPIVARALAKEPAERWPDCRSFVEALELCRAAGSPELIRPSDDEEPGPTSEEQIAAHLPACAYSDIPTGVVEDSWELDESSVRDLGTSVMNTVSSADREIDPGPVCTLPPYEPQPTPTGPDSHVSGGLGLVLLTVVTTILGWVAMGGPSVPRAASRGAGHDPATTPSAADLARVPADDPHPQGHRREGRRSGRPEDAIVLSPSIRERVVSSHRAAPKPGDDGSRQALDLPATGATALKGPASQAPRRPECDPVAAAQTRLRLDELRALAMRWIAIAAVSIEQAERCYGRWLHAAVTTLAGPGEISPARDDGGRESESTAQQGPVASPAHLAAPETVGTPRGPGNPPRIVASNVAAQGGAKSDGALPGIIVPTMRDGLPLASGMQGTYQISATQPVEPVAPVTWYWYSVPDPTFVNAWGLYYTPPSYYEAGMADYSTWWQLSPGTPSIRAGRGGLFRRGGNSVRYYMRAE
jgi:serine/threonine protein kinase